MGKKWNIESVKKYALKNGGCEVLSDVFTKVSEKLQFKCKCGNIFERTWNNYKDAKQYQCIKCANKNTGLGLKNDFNIIVELYVNKNLKLLDTTYIDMNTKMTSIDEDGYKIYASTHQLENGNPYRFGKSNPYTIENINTYIKNHKIQYKLLSTIFVSSTSNLLFECENGHQINLSWNAFKNGDRCKECHLNKVRKSHSSFVSEVKAKYNNEFTVLGKYHNNRDKILIQHNPCGTTFEVRPFELLGRWHGCPVCCISKGEDKCLKWLTLNQFKFQREFIFKDLNSDKGFPLRYDFAILNNDKVIYLIEYDGEFHYRNTINTNDLSRRKKLDKMKDVYAQVNNIPLLRIPYWELDNVENILNKELQVLSNKI